MSWRLLKHGPECFKEEEQALCRVNLQLVPVRQNGEIPLTMMFLGDRKPARNVAIPSAKNHAFIERAGDEMI
ncbi:MAG TPA: hypothetical protein VK335_13735 [Bryobacteraceae bacterium]|nr:hypothetical protein [Bryobacteraceae bacterium]